MLVSYALNIPQLGKAKDVPLLTKHPPPIAAQCRSQVRRPEQEVAAAHKIEIGGISEFIAPVVLPVRPVRVPILDNWDRLQIVEIEGNAERIFAHSKHAIAGRKKGANFGC